MGGHGHGHGMSHMGGGRGGGGGGAIIPFRAGDWKCGSEGCSYHNFAKNVSCLRCGASRANAMVVADSTFGTPSMNSNMNTPAMSTPSSYGMPPHQMVGTPGSGYGPPPDNYGHPSGFHGQQYGGPPSTYALPSGIGAGGNTFPPMGGHYNAPGAPPSGAFDSRAENAFTSAGQTPSSMGPSMSNGNNNNNYGGFDGSSDPFSFLSTGIGSLSMDDGGRRNGANNPTKSPAA